MHGGFNDTATLETNGDAANLIRFVLLIFLGVVLGLLFSCTMNAFYILSAAGTINLQKDEGFPHHNIPLTVYLAEDYIGIHGLK